jgi:alginate O-acetyltransferase complex protein AlgI
MKCLSFRIFVCSLLLLLILHWLTTPNEINQNDIRRLFFPIVWISMTLLLLKMVNNRYVSYLLFFAVSITSFLNITKTQNGMFIENPNLWLYGMSFFSLSLAFLNFQKRGYRVQDIWVFGNPLLVITGPIITTYRKISGINIKRRWHYFGPYVFIGIFFFKVIAMPLVPFFELKNFPGYMNLLALGIIFEVFVYFNFAGLSLMIYGLFGIFGLEVPLNFRQPFSSRNLLDFWKGWHTSISTVLKTMFYQPLKSRFNSTVALFVVFISSAIWHGVTWNFFVWGLLHFIAYWLSKIMLNRGFNRVLLLILMIFTLIIARIITIQTELSRFLLNLKSCEFKGIVIFNNGKLSLVSLVLGLVIIVTEFIFFKHPLFVKRNYKFLRISKVFFIVIILMVLFIHNTNFDYAVYNQR